MNEWMTCGTPRGSSGGGGAVIIHALLFTCFASLVVFAYAGVLAFPFVCHGKGYSAVFPLKASLTFVFFIKVYFTYSFPYSSFCLFLSFSLSHFSSALSVIFFRCVSTCASPCLLIKCSGIFSSFLYPSG